MKKPLFLFLFIVAILCVIEFFPMKLSIRDDQLPGKEDYILVRVQKSTVAFWLAIGDQNGLYDNAGDVRIIGNEPGGYDYDVEIGENTFVCYGKYVKLNHQDEAGTYDIFEADYWDIMYPIQRESIFRFLLPKSFLT